MRLGIISAVTAVLVCLTLTANSAPFEGSVVPNYDVKITLKSRDDKKEEIVLKATVLAGNPAKLTSPMWQRPFVTGYVDSTAKKPVIQVIKFGAVADVNIAETDTNAIAIDATIELSDSGICDVGEKKYPGTQERVQTISIASAKKRLIETISPNESLKCTLNLDGQIFDATLSVTRQKID